MKPDSPPLCYCWIDSCSTEAAALVGGHAQPSDHAHAARYRSPERVQVSVVARVLLRRLLAEMTGLPSSEWDIQYDEGGRPWALHPDIASPCYVSLSHSGPFIAVACSRHGAVAVDLERGSPRRSWREISEVLFPAAAGIISDSHDFHRAWCLHEAWIKIHGGSVWCANNSPEFGRLLEGVLAGREDDPDWTVLEFTPCAGVFGLVLSLL